MKKTGMLIMLMMMSLVFVASVFAQEGGNLRYSVMVSKFENRSNWSGQWNLADTFGSVLTESLHNSGRFIVIAEKDMRREAL
ncbi:MAG: hypothetical protein WC291_04530, partial [Thermodesulfovibrionales bacterium]